jgi:2'-5' RNA ligase
MTLRDIGVFPNIRYPRVIWMGLEDKTERLLILQKNIEENLNILGFTPEERKFSPHLTIGRLKSLKGKSRLANMIHAKKDMNIDGSISVNKINLIKSELRVTGPIYSVLETVSLA